MEDKRGGKKGLSTVVTTLIIILLVIIALGIVWIAVNNLLIKNSSKISGQNFFVDLELTKASKIGNEISLTIKRNAGAGELSKIKFVFESSDGITQISEREAPLEELDSKDFRFTPSDLTNIQLVEKVLIYPVYTNGEIGSVGDSKTVSLIVEVLPNGEKGELLFQGSIYSWAKDSEALAVIGDLEGKINPIPFNNFDYRAVIVGGNNNNKVLTAREIVLNAPPLKDLIITSSACADGPYTIVSGNCEKGGTAGFNLYHIVH